MLPSFFPNKKSPTITFNTLVFSPLRKWVNYKYLFYLYHANACFNPSRALCLQSSFLLSSPGLIYFLIARRIWKGFFSVWTCVKTGEGVDSSEKNQRGESGSRSVSPQKREVMQGWAIKKSGECGRNGWMGTWVVQLAVKSQLSYLSVSPWTQLLFFLYDSDSTQDLEPFFWVEPLLF